MHWFTTHRNGSGLRPPGDRDRFSYLDVYEGTEYMGTVRVRDRLVGYDILGGTLAVLVDRQPGVDGIARRAIDWYRIDEVTFGGP